MMLALVNAAVANGARLTAACDRLGVSPRTVQRWRKPQTAEDRRCGPRSIPANSLTETERRRVLAIANSEEFRNLSPKQIVPRLADKGQYVASEATFYRLLKANHQLAHRSRAKAPSARVTPRLKACRPCQLWSWDITYLKSPVRGVFFYLYLAVDVYSRRIVGWDVHAEESSASAAALMRRAFKEAGRPPGLTSHSDNGAPMKGNTLLATLQALGVVPSFSRPSVSNDNPFSEALFRTLKYSPAFPDGPFATLEAARGWVANFVHWYNTEHRHSGIRFVTPNERHYGRELGILRRRQQLYRRASRSHPERWSGAIRNWQPAGPVSLNPTSEKAQMTAV